MRAKLHRPVHRHRRSDTEFARIVTGGQHHAAAPAAADDHRLVDEFRMVAFFNGRVEGVTIDMGNLELIKLPMREDARRTAGEAGRFPRADIRQTIPAERAHPASESWAGA